jgi:hypothetical protein
MCFSCRLCRLGSGRGRETAQAGRRYRYGQYRWTHSPTSGKSVVCVCPRRLPPGDCPPRLPPATAPQRLPPGDCPPATAPGDCPRRLPQVTAPQLQPPALQCALHTLESSITLVAYVKSLLYESVRNKFCVHGEIGQFSSF